MAKGRKTEAPDEMLITSDMVAWVNKECGLIPRDILKRERDSFLDRNRATGGMYVDWTAAWRNWMRNYYFKFGGKEEIASGQGGAETELARLDAKRAEIENADEQDIRY